MSRTYSAIFTGLLVGLTVGITDFILEILEVHSRLAKPVVFSIAVYIVLKAFEKCKTYKTNSVNVPE